MSAFNAGDICVLHSITGQYAYYNGTKVQLIRALSEAPGFWVLDIPDPCQQDYGGAIAAERNLRKEEPPEADDAARDIYADLMNRIKEGVPA